MMEVRSRSGQERNTQRISPESRIVRSRTRRRVPAIYEEILFVLTKIALRSTVRENAAGLLWSPSRVARFLFLSLLAGAASCSRAPLPRIAGAPAAPPSASEPWRAPARAVPPEPPRGAVDALPVDVAARRGSLLLADVVDLALRNNPQTQLSWAQARAGAASYGAATASWFPTVDA